MDSPSQIVGHVRKEYLTTGRVIHKTRHEFTSECVVAHFGRVQKNQTMKKFLTSAGLIAVGISNIQAASPVDLSPIEASKPWSVSAALRGFYDDNYTTSPSDSKRSSIGYQLTPSASLNLPMDQTFIGLSYEYSLLYFEDRRSNKYDQNHKFDARLDHAFTERYKIAVNDSFVIAQEPEVSLGAVTSPLRTEGDYLRNLGTIKFTAQATELVAVELGYSNTFIDYEQDENSKNENGDTLKDAGLPSRTGLLDRIEHAASIDLRWRALPDTDAIVGYQFGIVDFTGDEVIGSIDGEDIYSDDRNSRSHRVYVGADHRFNAQLSGSVRVGGQYTDYYNQNQDSVSPYADANLTYQYGRGNYIQGGVSHTRARTDVFSVKNLDDITVDQEVTAAYVSVNHKITPKLTGSLLVQGQHATFDGGNEDGNVEYYFLPGINFSYRFSPYLLAEAGYNFDRLDSDSGRSYSRNRVYLGVRATY